MFRAINRLLTTSKTPLKNSIRTFATYEKPKTHVTTQNLLNLFSSTIPATYSETTTKQTPNKHLKNIINTEILASLINRIQKADLDREQKRKSLTEILAKTPKLTIDEIKSLLKQLESEDALLDQLGSKQLNKFINLDNDFTAFINVMQFMQQKFYAKNISEQIPSMIQAFNWSQITISLPQIEALIKVFSSEFPYPSQELYLNEILNHMYLHNTVKNMDDLLQLIKILNNKKITPGYSINEVISSNVKTADDLVKLVNYISAGVTPEKFFKALDLNDLRVKVGLKDFINVTYIQMRALLLEQLQDSQVDPEVYSNPNIFHSNFADNLNAINQIKNRDANLQTTPTLKQISNEEASLENIPKFKM